MYGSSPQQQHHQQQQHTQKLSMQYQRHFIHIECKRFLHKVTRTSQVFTVNGKPYRIWTKIGERRLSERGGKVSSMSEKRWICFSYTIFPYMADVVSYYKRCTICVVRLGHWNHCFSRIESMYSLFKLCLCVLSTRIVHNFPMWVLFICSLCRPNAKQNLSFFVVIRFSNNFEWAKRINSHHTFFLLVAL